MRGKARTSETRTGQRLSSCLNCDVQKVVLWRCVIFDTLRVPLFAAAEGRTQDLRIMRPTRLPTAPPRHAKRPPLADHLPIPKAARSGARPSKKHGFFFDLVFAADIRVVLFTACYPSRLLVSPNQHPTLGKRAEAKRPSNPEYPNASKVRTCGLARPQVPGRAGYHAVTASLGESGGHLQASRQASGDRGMRPEPETN